MATLEERIADMEEAAAEQVEASQLLTDEVTGKMAEIDQIINETASSILAGFTSATSGRVNLYVDSLDGDDNNDGQSLSSALKTVDHALNIAPDGRTTIIRLTPGLIYPVNSNHHGNNRNILFYKNTDRGDLSTNPVITIPSISDGTYNRIAYQFHLNGTNVRFDHCDISISGFNDPALPWSNIRSWFNCFDTLAGIGLMAIHNSKLSVADGSYLARCHVGGNYNISIRGLEIEGSGYLLGDADNGTVNLGVYGLTLSSGAGFVKGKRINAEGLSNITTNYTGSIEE